MQKPKEDISKFEFQTKIGEEIAKKVQKATIEMIQKFNIQSKKIKNIKIEGIHHLMCIHYLMVRKLNLNLAMAHSRYGP